MQATATQECNFGLYAHPNELDQRRIERALKDRQRYRYVTPSVVPIPGGYRIESPCCSRNVDQSGGIVDVALIYCDDVKGPWRLYCKDHVQDEWQYAGAYETLSSLMELLNADPGRVFWQ